MKQITQTIQSVFDSYNPNEFLPIFRDGQLDNRTEFIAYKAKKFVGRLRMIYSK